MFQLVRLPDALVISSAFNPHKISTLALAMDNARPSVTVAPNIANGAYEWTANDSEPWIKQFYRLVEYLPVDHMLVLDFPYGQYAIRRTDSLAA